MLKNTKVPPIFLLLIVTYANLQTFVAIGILSSFIYKMLKDLFLWFSYRNLLTYHPYGGCIDVKRNVLNFRYANREKWCLQG